MLYRNWNQYYFIILLFIINFANFTQVLKTNIWDGAIYDKNSSPQYEAAIKALELHQFKKNERVLDIGCGSGKITAVCAQKLRSYNGSIVGIDNAESMIEFAQKNYTNEPNLRFYKCDAMNLPFESEFDFVFSSFCLHWVTDKQKAINQIAKSLKPGGSALLYISLANEWTDLWYSCYHTLLERPEWKVYKKSLLHLPILEFEKDWVLRCKNAGFSIVKAQIINREVVFQNYDAFIKWKLALSVTTAIPQEKRALFVDELSELFFSRLGITKNASYVHIASGLLLEVKK